MPTTSMRTAPRRAGLTQRATQWLLEQHWHKRPFDGFPVDFAPNKVEQAYAIQDEFVAAKTQLCGEPIGWKIALSNPAMQRFVQLHEAIAARMHARQIVAGPARVASGDYGRLLIEFEIAVELGADLPPRRDGYNRQSVGPAVAAVRPAFELADDRGADYATLNRHGLQLIADNAWNEGAVLGERRIDWWALDLSAIRGEVRLNGEPIGAGHGRDLMGHPLDALAWLASHASRRGLTMRAGQVAILGSMVTSKFPERGQRYQFELDGFAPLELNID